MLNKIKFLTALVVLSTILIACGKSDKTTTSEKEKTTRISKQETGNSTTQKKEETGSTGKTENTKPGKPELKWEFKRVGTGEYDTPINDVDNCERQKTFYCQGVLQLQRNAGNGLQVI